MYDEKDNPLRFVSHKPGIAWLDREVEVCDFCLQPPPVGWYQLPPNTIRLSPINIEGRQIPVFDQDGQWDACQPCHDLIEAGDWHGLIRRVLEQNPGECGGSATQLRELYKHWARVRGSSPFVHQRPN